MFRENTMQALFNIQRPPVYTVSSDLVIDTFVNSENPYMNYCRDYEMLVRGSRQISFLAFTAPIVPDYGEAIGAILKLYKLSEAATTIKIYAAEVFDEYSLTWANRPAQGELLQTITLGVGVGEYSIDLSDAYLARWVNGAPIAITIEADSFARIATTESVNGPAFLVEYEDTRVAFGGMRTLPGSILVRHTREKALPGSVIINSKNKSLNLPGSILITAKPRVYEMPGSITVRHTRYKLLMGSLNVKEYDGGATLLGSIFVRQPAVAYLPGSISIRQHEGSKPLTGSMVVRALGGFVLPGSISITAKDRIATLAGTISVRAVGEARLPGSLIIKSYTGTATLSGSMVVRENYFLPGSITIRQSGQVYLPGEITVRPTFVLPGSVIVRQPYLPGSITVRQTGEFTLPGSIIVKERELFVLSGSIIVKERAKGYFFIL